MTPILVRFFAAIGRPIRNAALANSLTVTPEGDSPFARLWWSNADGEPKLIRTHNQPWTRPTGSEVLQPGGRYLVNPGVTPLRLPLLGDGELVELRPEHDKTWASGDAQLIPSSGWNADSLPALGSSMVQVVADQSVHHYWVWAVPLESSFNNMIQRVETVEELVASEAATRAASDTSSAAAAAANYAAIQNQLAAEAAARVAASQQPFELTTNGMTLDKFRSYTLSAAQTVSFPVMISNEWIRVEPGNGDWYSIGATLNLPAGWVFDPPTLNGVEPNAALLFIANASTLKLRVRQ